MNRILKYTKGDRAIWLVVLFLAVISTLVVYTSITSLAYRHHDGNTFYYLFRHTTFLAIGIGIMYGIHRIKYVYISRIAQLALYVSIPLLLLTLLIGSNLNNASRWLVIPVINQSFQTSDLAKLALIMYIARILSIRQDVIKDFKKAFLPIVVPIFLVCGLIFPANFSTAAVLFTASLVLMFIGRISLNILVQWLVLELQQSH
ncbi:MAG: FtsW/RodA/SpoVE family cell cycle protein [Flavobacteriales bacterium]|nr:FtsW/RodA/SpoVE family cell cycle protein [Flavobacteriales bacterium]